MVIEMLQEKERDPNLPNKMRAMSIVSQTEILLSEKLSEDMDRVEKRTGISVRDYMGFGNISRDALKYFERSQYVTVSEINSDNKPHGRGIRIDTDGFIYIQYWNNGRYSPGNYIRIFSNGKVVVAECYLYYGQFYGRGTRYRANGT